MTKYVTPFTNNYPTGARVKLYVPKNYFNAGKKYTFVRWENDNTSRTRIITVTAAMLITAFYQGN